MIYRLINSHTAKYSFLALLILFLLGCQEQIDNNSQVSVLPESPQSDSSDSNNSENTNPNSLINKNPEPRKPAETKTDAFENPDIEKSEYPKESCGTELPDQRRLYPLIIYPVFIEYTEERLQSIKAEYCKDALKVRRTVRDSQSGQETEEDFIQVASFVYGDSELNYFEEQGFKEFYPNQDLIELGAKEPTFLHMIANRYGSLESGSETQVNTPSELKDQPEKINYELSQAAKLTEPQVDELLTIGEVNAMHEENEPDKKFILGIILPSYLPNDFVVDEFSVNLQPEYGSDTYSISYKNSNNQCFSLHVGPIPSIGDSPSDSRRFEVSSEAIPNLVIEYFDSDRISGLRKITTPSGYYTWNGFQAFEFYSPSLSLEPSDCTAINLEEAQKIAESLRFLNP